MERMTGLDATFLAMETPAHPMHTLKLLLFEPLKDRGVTLDAALEPAVRARLHLVPAARRRVLPVPHGLHHPLWIEDPDFELAAHLKRVVVPAPGTRAEVDGVIAAIAADPLDRSRPLWEMWILEGLEGGRVGALLKVHHAVADGLTVARLLGGVMTDAPDDRAPPPAESVWSADRIPSSDELMRSALRDHLRHARRLPRLVRRTLGRMEALARERRSSSRSPLPVVDAPRTSFNRALTAPRSFASTGLPLARLREVKSAFGVTLNDVVLALASAALRQYLVEGGALPSRSLLASVPTNSSRRSPGDAPRRGGNHVSSLFVSLETQLEDSVERLQAIHRGAAVAKQAESVLGADLMEAWAEYVPPRVLGWALRSWASSGLADHVPPPLNAIVSNVPGSSTPLFVPGHRLAEIASVGPILEGIGVNITAWSYLDTLHVGVLGCRDLMPEPRRLTAGIHEELATLHERAGREVGARGTAV